MLATAATAAFMSVSATSYCLHGRMADGTYTRKGSVAMNGVPLGTRVRIVGNRSFFGQRRFIVRDRIGWGSRLDFWHPSCSQARKWGRRSVRIRLSSP